MRHFMVFLLGLALLQLGCSTTATFKIPEGTSLFIHERPVGLDDDGRLTTRPFFWTAGGGVKFKLKRGSEVLDEGRLSVKFRPASIFWPPFALIYWPLGFRFQQYDLVNPTKDGGINSSRRMLAPKVN